MANLATVDDFAPLDEISSAYGRDIGVDWTRPIRAFGRDFSATSDLRLIVANPAIN
jgi:hypothetical protein